MGRLTKESEIKVELVSKLDTIILTSPLGFKLDIEFDTDLDVHNIEVSGYRSPLLEVDCSEMDIILDMSDDEFDDMVSLLLKAREVFHDEKSK